MGNVFWYVLALIVPLIFLWIIREYDFYQTGQFSLIILCLCWGAIVYGPTALTNWSLVNSRVANQDTVDHFIAPILEELLKGLLLFYLVRRAQFTYLVDGALYGFATGIGFAIFENFENVPHAYTILEIILRILSTNLVHAFSSAAIGIALGIFLLRDSRSRWLIFFGGVIIAIGQHMIFNIMGAEIHPIVKIFPGFLGMLFIYFVMQLGVKQAQSWIKEKLGMEDRVTQQEVTAINRLTGPEDALFPVVERFGVEKARMVEKLLNLQARIGIKRKALDGFGKNDKIRNDVEAEINQMRTDMEKVQREIGTYTMLFVRGLFTEEMISVWEQMQVKIQERSALKDGQKGGGVWSSLDERLKTNARNEESE